MPKIQGLQFKVVGVTFDNRQANLKLYDECGLGVYLKREPSNIYDANAIQVMGILDGISHVQLGYIGKQYAVVLAPLMDNGTAFTATVDERGVFAEKGIHYISIRVDEV